jgi:hypothetical protein
MTKAFEGERHHNAMSSRADVDHVVRKRRSGEGDGDLYTTSVHPDIQGACDVTRAKANDDS